MEMHHFSALLTEKLEHIYHLETEISTNLRLGREDRKMEGSGLFQSLNIEADVKSNGSDEGASVDVIVMKMRAGEEMLWGTAGTGLLKPEPGQQLLLKPNISILDTEGRLILCLGGGA